MKKLLFLALTLNLCLIVEGRTQTNVLEIAKAAASGRIPWTETFATAKLDSVKWPVNRGAESNVEGLAEPSAPYALNLDGNENGGDEIQTQVFNFAGMNNVRLEYAYQRGGSGNLPEAGDDLWVEYLNAAGQWVILKKYSGAGGVMTAFAQETMLLPAGAHHAGFRLRFRNQATPGPNDDWFIDDLKLSPSPDMAITPPRLSTNVAWPGSVAKTLTIRNDGHSHLNFQITSRDKSVRSSASPAAMNTEVSSLAAVPGLKIGLIQAGVSVGAIQSRLLRLGYRNIFFISPASNLAELKKYDIVYLPSSWAQFAGGSYSILQARSADYLAYVKEGGGLFVDQPNPAGQPGEQVTPGLLPYPITFTNVYDRRDWPPVIVKANHEITQSLKPEEMPGPGDRITGLAAQYEILVRGAYLSRPSLVVTTYGRGRVLVQTANASLQSANPISNAAYTRMIEWVAKKNLSWLRLTPGGGTVAPGDSLKISLQFDSRNDAPGLTYKAELVISTNDPDEASVIVPAEMIVNPVDYFVDAQPIVSAAVGYGKDVVTHALRIRNYGQNSDSYNLIATGNRWRTQFFDSTGAKQITRTPVIPGGSSLKIFVKVTIDSAAAKGKQDTAQVTITSMGNPTRSSSAKLTTASQGLRINITTVPFTEDFSKPTLDPAKWVENSGPAVVNTRGVAEPSAPNSLNLNGADVVRSQAIDLSGKSGVLLRYAYEMGGDGDPADWGNDLYVDYLDGENQWINLRRHAGNSAKMTAYAFEAITLPPSAYHRNFALRFRATGKPNSDDWFVDAVLITPPPDILLAPKKFNATLSLDGAVSQSLGIGNAGKSELHYSITFAAPVAKIDAARHAEYLAKLPPRDSGLDKFGLRETDFSEVGQPKAALTEAEPVEAEAGLAKPAAAPAKIYWDYYHSDYHSNFSSLLKELRSAGHAITEMNAPITPLALAGFDLLVIETPRRALLNEEILAIQALVNNGRGLFVIGDAEVYIGPIALVSLNSLLKPYGLSLSNSWNSHGVQVRNFTPHPVTANVRGAELAYYGGITASTPATKLAITNEGVVVLAASQSVGRIVLIADFDPLMNDRLYRSDNLLLNLNIIDWLRVNPKLNWVTADPTVGKVAPGDSATIALKFKAQSLIPGRTYHTNLVVTSNDPDESSITLPVQMAVKPEPYFVGINPAAATGDGYSRDVVTHALRLHNYGANNDSYTLRLAGNRWRAQIFDSAGTAMSGATPNIATGGSLKIFVKVTVDSLAAKDKKDTVRVIAVSVANPSRSGAAKLTTASRGPRPRITKLPFSDDFSSTSLDTLRWFNNAGPADVSTQGASEPSPPYALHLNATDLLRSQGVDLSGKTGVLLQYAYEMGGDADPAERGNDLFVEYIDRANNWIVLRRHPGGGDRMRAFLAEEILLPPGAHHRNFAIRFRTTGKSYGDDWFIDDVRVFLPPEIAINSTPAPFEFKLNLGDSAAAAFIIKNEGAGRLDFQIEEVDSIAAAAKPMPADQFDAAIETVPATTAAAENNGVAPHTNAPHKIFQPQNTALTGGRVLWDLTHGVLPGFELSNRYINLNAFLAKSRYSIATTTSGVDNIALSSYDVLVVSLTSAWYSVYPSREVAAIRRFVENGGGLLIMGDYATTPNQHINPVAQAFGITCGGYAFYEVISRLAAHPISKGVHSLRYGVGGEINVVAPGRVVAWSSDNKAVAAVATRGRGRVVVTGDSDFCTNYHIDNDNNQLFVENIFNWLAEKGPDPDWLQLTPASGIVAPISETKITASVNARHLLPGRTYRKNIFISSNDVDEKIVRLAATLHVNPAPYFVLVDPATSQGQGYGKDAVTHALRIFNLGQNNDSYTLMPGGNKWKTQFYDSTGAGPITTTPMVTAGSNLKILVKVTIDSLASKGAGDTVRVTVASAGKPEQFKLAKLTTFSRGIRVRIAKLPFTENFSAAKLDSLKWLDNLGPASVNTRGVNEPSTPTSLNLNGTDEVRSQTIDLSGKSGVQIRYAYQMGGEADVPDSGNDLWLDYLNNAGKWVNLKRHLGNGNRMNFYNSETFTLPEGAYHKNFAFRFRVTGKLNVDDWFVDDLAIALPPVMAVTPEFIKAKLNKGDSTTQTLTIENRGESDLNYFITIRERASSSAAAAMAMPSSAPVNLGPLSQSQHDDGVAMMAPAAAAASSAPHLRILAWTGYADLSREYPNTLAALRQFYANFALTATSEQTPAALQKLLNAADVFLIPEQETSLDLKPLGTSWKTTLNHFVSNGGTVLVLDHGAPSVQGSSTLLNGTGLMQITVQAFVGAGSSVRVVDAAHPLTLGLPRNFIAMNGNNTHVANGAKIIANVSSGAAVVSAQTIGSGHVVYLGMDFFEYNPEMARLLANAVQWQGVRVAWLALPGSGANTIAPGDSQNIKLLFNAATLAADTTVYADLLVNSNDPGRPIVTIPASLHTASAAALAKQTAPTAPKNFALHEAYPNPFSANGIFNNPETAIEYELPRDSQVRIQIFDSMGRTVRTLVDESKTTGYHRVIWNGRNQLGNTVAAGVYLCRMTARTTNGETVFGKTQRMTLVK